MRISESLKNLISNIPGDSGGGFFVKLGSIWALKGIVSASVLTQLGVCDVGRFSVFTNVVKYLNWIKNVANIKPEISQSFPTTKIPQSYATRKTSQSFLTTTLKFTTPANAKIQAGINLKCIFGKDVEWTGVTHYKCNADSLTVQADNVRLSSVVGNNLEGFSKSDVSKVFMDEKILNFLPNGIGELFPILSLLSMGSSKVKFIARKNFKNMKNLKILHLFDNEIEEIPKDTFHDLEGLETLNLYDNKIASLHPDTFLNLRSLDSLRLSHNRIQVIDKNLLRDNVNLKHLDFYGNNIQKIFVDFTGVGRLVNIDLLGNSCINSRLVYDGTYGQLQKFQETVRAQCS